jgi:hypothetical protein
MMKWTFLAVGCALAVGGSAVSATAKPKGGQAVSDVATCVVDNDMTTVRSLLKTVPGSPAEAKVAVKLLDLYGGCNNNTSVVGGFAWRERAEIAEAAAIHVLERGKTTDVAAAATDASWVFALPAGAQPPADYDTNNVGMRMLGDCVVRANPQGALALIRADRGSAAEAAAIAGLSGNFASCLTTGQTFKLKRQNLRLVVAEPLYHLLSR